MKNTLLISVVILIMVIIVGCGANTNSPDKDKPVQSTEIVTEVTVTSTPEATAIPTPEVEKAFKIGEVVNLGNIEFIINGTRVLTKTESDKPAEGKVFYIIDATINNTGAEDYICDTIGQMAIIDSKGYTSYVTILFDIKPPLSSLIKPGRKTSGEVAFSVPKDASGLELSFIYDTEENKEAIFKLDR